MASDPQPSSPAAHRPILLRDPCLSSTCSILLGIVATIALAVVDEWVPDRGLILLAVVAALAIAGALRGRQLPLFLRVFATGATFYFGYAVCLVGRTMEPHLTAYTVQAALICFGLYAALPTLALLRIWKGRLGVALVLSMFPASLAAASMVAAYEEHQFVQKHLQGVGLTPRWTVSHHWLAYDARTKTLYGSD